MTRILGVCAAAPVSFTAWASAQQGPINAPTVLNSSMNVVQFWDGRALTLKEQAGGRSPIPGRWRSRTRSRST